MNTYCSVPDIEAEALVLALCLLNIEEVEGSRKGKLQEDVCLTDEEVAFNFPAEYLKASLAELHDRIFALSLDEALETDSAALSVLSCINQGEQDHHISALALERGDEVPIPTHSQEILEWTVSLSNNDITGVVEPDPGEMDDLAGPPQHSYCSLTGHQSPCQTTNFVHLLCHCFLIC
ncbi:uncharacterized protein F5891DRAFT_1006494 [Suillus fuscotomentosus]|uniref:Uncharacterized protein n=1 Tax=Suillus fuscotomentosus TaxID=1912939 RepID=A0AAD4EGD6_9AGAM|nr:uncharacterized protein F5891DRAFT_1006494 [Suillus fuscotomentosus]KAG1905770.1 hypothetical protein F5891DRAFT_1006494 [Suillus fuscotomentosus]